MLDVKITLPWPPTINSYWRRHGHVIHISSRGREYRKAVSTVVADRHGLCSPLFPSQDRLSVTCLLFPPDRRKRDIDNVLKSLLDALQHAGVYDDDSQIDRLEIARMAERRGQVLVQVCSINQIDGGECSPRRPR